MVTLRSALGDRRRESAEDDLRNSPAVRAHERLVAFRCRSEVGADTPAPLTPVFIERHLRLRRAVAGYPERRGLLSGFSSSSPAGSSQLPSGRTGPCLATPQAPEMPARRSRTFKTSTATTTNTIEMISFSISMVMVRIDNNAVGSRAQIRTARGFSLARSAAHTRSLGHGSLRPTVLIAVPCTTVASIIGSQMDPLIMARR